MIMIKTILIAGLFLSVFFFSVLQLSTLFLEEDAAKIAEDSHTMTPYHKLLCALSEPCQKKIGSYLIAGPFAITASMKAHDWWHK